MEVNKKQLADIFGASIRTIQNWQEQGMPVLRGGGKGNEVLYDSAAVIRWYAERGHRSPRGDVTFKSALQLSGSPQCLGELRLDRLRSYGHRWSERSSGSGDADRSRTEHLRERVRETR